MNKLFSTLLLMLCLAPFPALAEMDTGIGVWLEARAASGSKSSEVVAYYDHNVTKTVGIYATVVAASDHYREFYVGPKIRLTEWLEVGVGVGRESIRGELRNSPRYNVWAAIDTDEVSIYVTKEDGGSGPWHKAYALYKVTETISAGAMYETLLGVGPRIDYAISKKITAWAAALRRDKETTSLLAVNFSF